MKNKACAVSQTNILSNSQQSVLFMTVKKNHPPLSLLPIQFGFIYRGYKGLKALLKRKVLNLKK